MDRTEKVTFELAYKINEDKRTILDADSACQHFAIKDAGELP